MFIDDAAAAWAALPSSGTVADELQAAAGLRRGQVAVLASGLLRLLVLLMPMVLEGDKLVFNASGFVSSPRLAAGTRSELLLRLMKELKESGEG